MVGPREGLIRETMEELEVVVWVLRFVLLVLKWLGVWF